MTYVPGKRLCLINKPKSTFKASQHSTYTHIIFHVVASEHQFLHMENDQVRSCLTVDLLVNTGAAPPTMYLSHVAYDHGVHRLRGDITGL